MVTWIRVVSVKKDKSGHTGEVFTSGEYMEVG